MVHPEYWTLSVYSPSPVQAVLTTLLQPVSKAIQQVQAFREQNRTSPLFNHLSAVSESVPALGWVAMVRLGMAGGEAFWRRCLFVIESESVSVQWLQTSCVVSDSFLAESWQPATALHCLDGNF